MKLHKYETKDDGTKYFFWCPGCDCCHQFSVGRKQSPNWSFDGNMDRPTFSPSLLMFATLTETGQRKTYCHLFLKEGRIQYLDDCPHKLKGQTIDMVEIPPDYGLPKND